MKDSDRDLTADEARRLHGFLYPPETEFESEIEAFLYKRWLAINGPGDTAAKITPEQCFHDIHYLMFQLERERKARKQLEEAGGAIDGGDQ